MRCDIVVLGGGKSLGKFGDAECKAYVRIGGKMMAERVLATMKKCVDYGKLVYVSASDSVPETIRSIADRTVTGGARLIESAARGLEATDAEYAAFVPSDIPLVTEESFRDFMDKCRNGDASFFYSFVRKETSEKKYPGLRHTYVKLKDGTFCGGSFFLVKRADFPKGESFFRLLSEKRKNPLELAALFGPLNIAKMLMGILSIRDLEKRASKIIGAKVSSFESEHPEMAFNVDEPEDVERAEAELSRL